MKKRGIHSRATSKYVFLLPGFLFFTFAVLIPLILGINIAFTDWNGITKDYNYVGFDNFIRMFSDKRILAPVRNTLLFALFGTAGNNIISLGLALLVNQKIGKWSNAAKILFFVPVCFSAVLTAFLWGFIYREVLSQIFSIKNLLGNRNWVIFAITVMGLWNTCGINMLIYLSGLKNIPTDLYEAAIVDGAGARQKFRHVTLPLLTPSFTVCITLTLTSWLREFAMTLSSTGGGPGGASRTISIYIFENLYRYNKAGYGQAISLVFVIALVLLGSAVSSFFRKREVEI
ncbi:sugar ABC transporter permease [Diplocloster hominis]|uniref:carbohydrate ABC transporter permease n=1 Tax=Diplocloster hominis TaxID=3079010 RepID=UPI0031B9CCA0